MTDSGIFFSLVAVNMSLASLAGLVIAFRRTGAWGAHDLYRLRQIVEWGFADVLLALLAFPLVALSGSEAPALRIMSAIAIAYLIVNMLALYRRRASMRTLIRLTPLVATVDVLGLSLATASIVVATTTSWSLVLIALTARPMSAFLMVLSTLGREDAA